jgi:putative glycosyltransferase (TIGR04348 family)
MRISLITPAPPRSLRGNRITALRWTRIFRALGHRVTVGEEYPDRPCDLLVALHARRSFASAERYRLRYPGGPLVVVLTGTDLYGDIHTDPLAQRALEMASRLVLLQPLGTAELPEHLREKARVIYQSARRPPGVQAPRRDVFEVCVLAHLRPVKDPLRAAEAARLLPAGSRVRVVHLGAALTPEMEQAARAEEAANFRYRWLGERPRWSALRILARSRLLVLSSTMEGGANVLSEAIAAGVPVLASRIPGSVGILGAEYPGYFPVGDTQALAGLLRRAEEDAGFYQALRDRCVRLQPLVDPARERRAWDGLLGEVGARPCATAKTS